MVISNVKVLPQLVYSDRIRFLRFTNYVKNYNSIDDEIVVSPGSFNTEIICQFKTTQVINHILFRNITNIFKRGLFLGIYLLFSLISMLVYLPIVIYLLCTVVNEKK